MPLAETVGFRVDDRSREAIGKVTSDFPELNSTGIATLIRMGLAVLAGADRTAVIAAPENYGNKGIRKYRKENTS